mmetsp:Transcript_11877/g.29119  ORF Transcript_11877/g.29119 Transcript_11877/m.29119 type:complete len:215 (-) Transcript_11877:151-795(-)
MMVSSALRLFSCSSLSLASSTSTWRATCISAPSNRDWRSMMRFSNAAIASAPMPPEPPVLPVRCTCDTCAASVRCSSAMDATWEASPSRRPSAPRTSPASCPTSPDMLSTCLASAACVAGSTPPCEPPPGDAGTAAFMRPISSASLARMPCRPSICEDTRSSSSCLTTAVDRLASSLDRRPAMEAAVTPASTPMPVRPPDWLPWAALLSAELAT